MQKQQRTNKPKDKVDKSVKTPQRDKVSFDFAIKQRDDLTEKQNAFLDLVEDKHVNMILFDGPAGCSKAQPLDALVLTPSGYKRMGDLKVGDQVIAVDGEFASIDGVFPQGIKDIYQVKFSDGDSTESTLDHLWFTQTSNDRNFRSRTKGNRNLRYKNPRVGSAKSLCEIQQSIIKWDGSKNARWNHSIPMVQPVKFNKELDLDKDIHPYLLGVLLGDGVFTAETITISSADPEIVDRCNEVCHESVTVLKIPSHPYNFSVKIKDQHVTPKNQVREFLKRECLFGLKSNKKFIPEQYKYLSIENRIELLRGLMDTDGHVAISSYFTTTSQQLSEGVKFIVNSLGGAVKTAIRKNFFYYKNKRKQGLDSFSMCISLPPEINPFFLKRKASLVILKSKYKPIRYIVGVEKVGSKECQCISVNHPKHLYLTNDCIVTHNTYLSILSALQAIKSKKVSHLIYARSIIESASKSIGALPGVLSEKLDPFLLPLKDKLDEFLDHASSNRLLEEGRIESIPINFLRGASFNATFFILDEGQNSTWKELSTVITRQGKYSKFIICGDSHQSDLNGNSGFAEMYQLFDNEEAQSNGIYCVRFDHSDIVRSGIVKYIVEKLDEYNAFKPKKSVNNS